MSLDSKYNFNIQSFLLLDWQYKSFFFPSLEFVKYRMCWIPQSYEHIYEKRFHLREMEIAINNIKFLSVKSSV